MITGLIIAQDKDNAIYLKEGIEHLEHNISMKIMTGTEHDYYLAETRDVDFVITPAHRVTEEELLDEILPFIRNVVDRKADNLALKKRRQIIYVDKNDIIGIEVIGKICYIHTITKGYSVFKITLGKLLQLIDDPYLVRCHKSFAVNLRFVKGFKRETRTRWKTEFYVDAPFDCSVTDLFMGNVIEKYEEYHHVEVSKFVEL